MNDGKHRHASNPTKTTSSSFASSTRTRWVHQDQHSDALPRWRRRRHSYCRSSQIVDKDGMDHSCMQAAPQQYSINSSAAAPALRYFFTTTLTVSALLPPGSPGVLPGNAARLRPSRGWKDKCFVRRQQRNCHKINNRTAQRHHSSLPVPVEITGGLPVGAPTVMRPKLSQN